MYSPYHCPQRLSETESAGIIALRRRRRIYRAISQATAVPASTMARVLQAAGINRLSRLESSAPGDLLHLDIKSPVVSSGRALAIPATDLGPLGAPARTMCMWPSTTTLAGPCLALAQRD